MSPFNNPFSDLGLRKGPVKILRPDPNFEEALERATEMNKMDIERVISYSERAKNRKMDCNCGNPSDIWARRLCDPCYTAKEPPPAIAPLLPLGYGRWIPSFGLGTWLGFGVSATTDDHSVELAVMTAIDAGYRHIDTAAIYGTEVQVGRAIAAKISQKVVKRKDLFITTKLWNDSHARDAVVPALRKSLQRLHLTYVDLYLIHWPTGHFADGTIDFTDYLETWKGMQEARNRGMTRSIGVSNFSQYQMERLIGFSNETPAVLQVELNLNLQQPELLAYCRQQHIAVTAYTPLGSIFHFKAAKDAPPPRIDDKDLQEIANKYKKTVPQIVLRYLVELGTIPIPKSVTPHRVEQNIAVFDFKFTDSETDLLKSYDCNFRTIVPDFVKGHPYCPFELPQEDIEEHKAT